MTRHCLLFWGLVAFLSPTASAAALLVEGKGLLIGTEFYITAPTFVESLGSKRTRLEKEISEEVARQGKARFDFADWRSVYGVKDRSDYASILMVTLIPRKDGMEPAIWLRFEGSVYPKRARFDCSKGGRVPSDSLYIGDAQLFRGSGPQYSGNKDGKLASELKAQLAAIFGNAETSFALPPDGNSELSAGVKVISTELLNRISLARTAELAGKLVILPFREEEFPGGKESEVGLSFCSKVPGRGEGGGEVHARKLASNEKRTDPEWRDRVQAAPSKGIFQGGEYDDIPALFGKRYPATLDVFMINYRKKGDFRRILITPRGSLARL